MMQAGPSVGTSRAKPISAKYRYFDRYIFPPVNSIRLLPVRVCSYGLVLVNGMPDPARLRFVL